MDKVRVLIADSTEDLAVALTGLLQDCYEIRTCINGNEAQNLLQSYSPDIFVFDMMMTGVDGISLLQTANLLQKRPQMLVTTRFVSDFLIEQLEAAGVEYVMVKPVDLHAVVSRILELDRHRRKPEPAEKEMCRCVSDLLNRFGIGKHLDGYQYLKSAVIYCMENGKQRLTVDLYPAVAAQMNVHVGQVERSIRKAIEYSWQLGDTELWKYFFPMKKEGIPRRPSNGVFISALADFLKSEKYALGDRCIP